MMTNMTFIKGIGTHVYMSLEILKRRYYEKLSDIYSFGIIMYEVVKWKNEDDTDLKEQNTPNWRKTIIDNLIFIYLF